MAQWGYMTGDANEEAKQYGEIIDKINKVADNFPTTSADIMDALKKTSSAFNLAGASIDETIATIVAAEKASQRGGKVIGTALANIVQQIKAEKKLDLAEQLGLNFFKDAKKTEFKPIMEIFQEMSDRMAALKSQGKESSTEMQQLLELFTVFRRNIGASLLGEMEGGEESTYMRVYKASLNSVGYSLQENTKYMATAKAAQEQFNVSLLQLKTEVWDKGVEDVYRNMLSFGTDVVKNITDLIDKFGLLPTTVGAATLAFTALNKNLRASEWIKMGEAVKKVRIAFQESETGNIKYNKVLKGTNSTFQDYVKSTENGKVSLAGYTKYLINTKAETILLTAKTIILQAAISAGLTLAITALVKGIDDWIHQEEKAIEKNKQLKQEAEDAATKINEQVKSIQNLTKEYKEFSENVKKSKDKNKLVDPENVKKAYELQEKINTAIKDSGKQVELVTKINDEYGEKVDAVNTKYKDQLSLLRTIAFEEKQREAQKLKEAMDLARENFKGARASDKKAGWFNTYSEQLRAAGIDQTFGGANKPIERSSLVKNQQSLLNGETQSVLANVNQSAIAETQKLAGYFEYLNSLKPEEQLKYLKQWNEQLDQAAKEGKDVGDVSEYIKEKLKNVQEQYNTVREATQKYTNALSELYALSGQVDVFDTMLTSIGKSYSSIEGPNKLINDIQAINEKFREGKINTKEYFDSLQEQIKSINLSENLDPEELEAYQAIFAATTETMAEGLDQLISGLETGAINFADYSSGVKEAAENTLDLYVKQNGLENIDGVWMKGKEAVDEYANSLQGALNGMNEMSELMPVIAKNYDYIAQHANEAGEAAFKQSDTTTQAYQTLANNVAASLNRMNKDNNAAYNAIVKDVFAATKSMTNEQKQANNWINQALLSDANALNAALNSSAQQLATNTNKVTTSMGNVMSALGDAISGFNYKITATPFKEGSFGLSTDENGIPNGIQLPSFGFKLTGEGGSSIQGLGSALKTFGSDLRDYSSSKFKYTTLKSAVGNYSSSGSPSLGSSGSSSGGKSSGGGGGSSKKGSSSKTSSKKDDDYQKRLEYFTNTIDRMESKEEEWVKKQKELGLLSNSDMVYITKRRIKEYEKYLDKIKKADWMNKEDRKKLQDEYNKKLKDLQLEYFDYLKGKLEDETKAIEKSRDERIKALEEETKNRKKLIEDEADARIAALKKVSDSRDRDREEEDYKKERQEILDEIAYWQQRTGREAVENLAKAKEKLKELDDDWAEKVEDWNTDDLIKSIEEQRDAQIKALEAESEKRKENIENEAQAQIDAIQSTYDAKVKAFSESNKIIYDDSVIAAKNLYDAYKKNFVEPLKEDLQYINKKKIDYTVKKGDTLESIAKEIKKTTGEKVSTIIKRIKSANSSLKNTKDTAKLKKGTKIKIPMYHQGGVFSGVEEGLALLKKGEWVLRPEWSNSMNRMMKYFDNVTQGKVSGLPMGNNSTIEVERKSD